MAISPCYRGSLRLHPFDKQSVSLCVAAKPP